MDPPETDTKQLRRSTNRRHKEDEEADEEWYEDIANLSQHWSGEDDEETETFNSISNSSMRSSSRSSSGNVNGSARRSNIILDSTSSNSRSITHQSSYRDEDIHSMRRRGAAVNNPMRQSRLRSSANESSLSTGLDNSNRSIGSMTPARRKTKANSSANESSLSTNDNNIDNSNRSAGSISLTPARRMTTKANSNATVVGGESTSRSSNNTYNNNYSSNERGNDAVEEEVEESQERRSTLKSNNFGSALYSLLPPGFLTDTNNTTSEENNEVVEEEVEERGWFNSSIKSITSNNSTTKNDFISSSQSIQSTKSNNSVTSSKFDDDDSIISLGGKTNWSMSKSVFSTMHTSNRQQHRSSSSRSSRSNSQRRRISDSTRSSSSSRFRLPGGGGGYNNNNNDDDNSSSEEEWSGIFSNASSSVTSGGGGGYKLRRSSSRNSNASHTSTVSGTTSVSSTSYKEISFKLPKRYRSTTTATGDDDNDQYSIGSLLSKRSGRWKGDTNSVSSSSSFEDNKNDDDDDASSGSFVGYSRTKDSSLLPIYTDFSETLSQLNNLGYGINNNIADTAVANDDDYLVGGHDDTDDDDDFGDTTTIIDDGVNNNDPLSAWWLKDLEEWFVYDTTSVYNSTTTNKKLATTTRTSATPKMKTKQSAQVIDADDGANEQKARVSSSNIFSSTTKSTSTSTTIVGTDSDDNKDKISNAYIDDFCDTSTIADMGNNNDANTDDDDWEERLWAVARAHYLQYTENDNDSYCCDDDASANNGNGFPIVDNNNNDTSSDNIDEHTVQECEQTYLNNYETEKRGVLSFRSVLLRCIETYVKVFHQHIPVATTTANDINTKVYNYVPLSTVRALVLEVIKLATSAAVDSSDSMIKKTEIVMKVLVDDNLNIFRRYQVVTMKPSSLQHDMKTKRRKRLPSKGMPKSNDAQAELEDFLYGEMTKNIWNDGHEDKADYTTTALDVLETREYEIRMRHNVVIAIMNNKFTSENERTSIDLYWANALMSKVMLSSIQSIRGVTATKQGQVDCQSMSSQNLSPPSSRITDEPMAQLYCMRYSPTILLRTLVVSQRRINLVSEATPQSGPADSIEGIVHEVTYHDLSNLLVDELYLMKRFEFQGPYDATITHLSNWQGACSIRSSNGDENEGERSYESLSSLIVTALQSHLKTTLVHTGYQGAYNVINDSTNVPPSVNNDKEEEDYISLHNYANIVATCLEIGRALHHLGVCLGRRQRDAETLCGGDNEVVPNTFNSALNLEMSSYKNALDAYKGAIYVLTKAENCSVQNASVTKKLENSTLNNEMVRELDKEISGVRDIPNNKQHDIREATANVELHLADTLNCLGYCHDKLSEYDKSLGAYRESLSLYIRHVGRFNRIVSNALHNMGAIHVELGQWKEATSCFRQCLAILKRIKERERISQSSSNQPDQAMKPLQEETRQMCTTLQCLGNSLAELGQYDASVACFQEIISEFESNNDEESTVPDIVARDVMSQLGRIHLGEAFKLSSAFNWQCHLRLFADNKDKKGDNVSLTSQLHAERLGKECILKSILSRRRICYFSSKNDSKSQSGVFSNVDNTQGISDDSLSTIRIGVNAPPSQIEALAKDLFEAGRVEFRSRYYKTALAYCWESLLLRGLLTQCNLNSSHTTKRVSSFLNYKEGETFQVPDDIIAVLDLVDKSSFIANTGIEIVQLLFILGLTYTRTRDFDKASKLLYKAHALVKAGDVTKGSLEEVVLMLDLAFLHIRLGFVQESMESTELADSNYKEAVQVFKSAASHPIFTSRHKRDDDLVSRNDDVASKITTLHKWQRKKLELILKHGLACALHRLGQSYARQRRADKAMKCFTDTANILNESHEVRASLSNWKSLSVFPIASRCFFQEIPAIYTAFILSDVYDRSGHISLESVSDQTSFHHFDLAIGIREFATTTIGTTLTVDSESLFECFDELTWDTRDMNCFTAMLQLIDEIESDDSDQNSGNAIWTKEDVLFRIGNLQMKAGQFREAVSSYREADKLTVKRLETRDHPIVMNINHNMGNALRAIVSSASTNDIDSAKSDAVACYSESMRISQVLFGKHHVTYADSLQSLAVLHTTKNLCLAITKDQDSDDNDDEIAYNSFRESLSIRKRELGSQNDLEIAFILQNLGDLCLRKLSIAEAYSFDDTETLKFVEDAISYLSESLEIRKLVLDQNHTSIGTTYQSLGIAHLYRAMACGDRMSSETNKAFTALTSALQIRKSLSSTLACRNSDLSDEINDSVLIEAHCIFYLGRVEETRSNFSEAKAFYVDAMRLFQIEGQRRLAESERVDERISIELDAINLWVSRVLFHMANIEKVTDRVEESISCYEEALRIHSRCKCTKSNSLMNALINLALAKALHDEGDYDKSIYCFAKSLRTYLAHFGKNSVDVAGTLTGMGKSFSMMMNYDKAIQCYEKAMRIYEFSEVLAIKEKKGLLHRDIAIIKQQSEDGHRMEALEHYRSCVSFLEEFNERNKVVTGEDKSKQLMIYYSEMLAILRKVIDIERDRIMKAELHDEIGDVLHRLGNLHATFAQYDEALECFAEVLKTQRVTNKDELRIADLLFNMGNIYLEQGKPDISCQCLSESYDITKLALGEDSKELHSTMYLMGVALTNISDYESALKFLSHALSVLRSKESNEDQSAFDKAARGKTLRQIGTVYESIGDHAKAISSLQESVQILKTVRGEDLELSNALNSLGNLLRNVSDFHQAMDCYDQSLAIRIELGDQVKIANTKNNIGAVLSALEELDRAMAFSAEALRIKTVHLGCNSVETGRALVNMGQLYFDQKLFARAEKYCERGLRIFQINAEVNQLDVATCMYKLGLIREALLDNEGALDAYLECIQIFKNNSSFEKNVTLACSLHNAASVYLKQEIYTKALDCMTEALNMKTACLGARHFETASTEHWLGIIYMKLGYSDNSLLHLGNALNARVECFGTEHHAVAETMYALAQAHYLREEIDETIGCLLENLRILRNLGRDEEMMLKAHLLLGRSYQELGDFDVAIEHLQDVLQNTVSLQREINLDVAEALFRLGICYCEKNEYPESLKKFKECLDIRISLLGNLHIECANTYESVGIVHQKLNSHEEAIHSFERALAIKRTSLDDDERDISVLVHFIGTSLFALQRYGEAVSYFSDAVDRKKILHGRTDLEYAMSTFDLAAAYEKSCNERLAMESYREVIESGGLSSDSWELGIAHKYLAGYFFEQGMRDIAIERYQEAVSIFEWYINNAQSSDANQEVLAECYTRLLEVEDEETSPITEARADLCYKLANCYVQVNKLEVAVPMYREAIMIQSQLYGTEHLSVANSLHNLGNCYRDLSDFEKSCDCLTKSLSLLQMHFEDENEEVADSYHCLGLTLVKRCELDEAILHFERALTIRKNKLGSLDLNVASSSYNLAVIHYMKGAWSAAMKYCEEALKIQRIAVGDDNVITINTLECIGRIHMDKGDFEGAMHCFRKCISQDTPKLQRECGVLYRSRGEWFKARRMFINAGEHVAESLGLSPPHSDCLDLQHLTAKFEKQKVNTSDRNLLLYAENTMYYGSILLNIDKLEESLECFRFSNIIFQAKFNSDHLTLAENFHYTGYILERMSDSIKSRRGLEEALELSTEAFRIRTLHLAENHPDLEETLLCLARTHKKLGNVGDSLHFLTRAIKARNNRLDSVGASMDDADALIQLGQLQQQAGQYRRALDSFEQSLTIKLRILDKQHPSIGVLLFYIGNLLREVGDLDLAQVKFEEALEIVEQADPDSIETADVLFSLGVLNTEQRKFSAALDAYLGSLQIHKVKGSSKTVVAEIFNNIGIAYLEMKEFDKSHIYHAEALESLRQELGEDHTDVAFCWQSLGTVLQELCDFEEALKCFKQALRIDRTEMYLQSLGICLVKMNDNEQALTYLDEALRMKSVECDNDSDDDLAEIQRHLGIIWMRKDQYNKALAYFEEALKIKFLRKSDLEKDHTNLMNCLDGALESVAEVHGTRHMKYARLLHKKGNLHGMKNEHSLAIEAYVEVLRIYKAEYGDSHLSVANTLFNLGVSLIANGSHDKARRCLEKALRISKAKLGEDHLDVADTYEQIAISSKLLAKFDDAKNYYEKSLSVRMQITGASDVKSAALIHELGLLYLQQESKMDDAERAFKESIRIRSLQAGEDALLAESMYNLGRVYTSRGDNINALKYLEGSLRIRKSKLVSSDIQAADNFQSLGGVHFSMRSFDKSVFCYDKAAQIYTEVYGNRNNVHVASSLVCKGESLRASKHYHDAMLCYSESLDIRKTIDGPNSSMESGDILSYMGDLYSELGDDSNASSSYASALSIYRQTLGSKHQTVADVLQKLADHFVKVREYERGYSCVKEALVLRQVLLGEDDIKTGDSQYCKGKILFQWNDYAEAVQCFERAHNIYKQLGRTHINIANSNFYLGCISEWKGEFNLAAKYLRDSLSGRQEALSENDSEVAENLVRLGHVYLKTGEHDLAVITFTDCLKIREASQGNDTASKILIADALFDLGTALKETSDTQRSMQLFNDALKEYKCHLHDSNDMKIAKCHSCMGEIYEKTNELVQAVNELELANAMYQSHVGSDHPSERDIKSSSNKKDDMYSNQAETLFRLGTVMDRLGNEVNALKHYRTAMRLYKLLFGRDSLLVAKILNRLANMKGRAGSVDKAMVLFDETLRIRMLHLGNNHEDVAETLFGMGIVFEKRRDYGAAMKAYSDCLRIRSSNFGSDSMAVAQVVVNIGVVRGNKGDFTGAMKSWNKALSIYRKYGLGDDDTLVSTVLSHQRLVDQLKKRRGSGKGKLKIVCSSI